MSEPLNPADPGVVAACVDSVTIGSDDSGGVFLSPEDAPAQSATIVHLLTTREVEDDLYTGGFRGWNWTERKTEMLVLHRWEISLCGRGTDAYAYSIAFGDDVDDEYIGDIKRHLRLDREPINISATR